MTDDNARNASGPPQTSTTNSLLCAAIELLRQGGALQEMRTDGSTVYQHSWGVALLAMELFDYSDLATVSAGLLHDAVERDIADLGQIEAGCGRRTAELVAGLTRHAAQPLPDYLDQIAKAGRAAVELKICDRLDSLQRARDRPPEARDSLFATTRDLYLPFARKRSPVGYSALTEALAKTDTYSS